MFSVNSDKSLPAIPEVHLTARLGTGNKSEICAEFVEKEQVIEEMAEDLTLREQANPRDITTASATNLNSLVELDIGTLDKNNATQMDLVLKMTCFNIPSTIPRDAANSAFPLPLLTKTLPNGETCIRGWLCWSKEKQSMYCVACKKTQLYIKKIMQHGNQPVQQQELKMLIAFYQQSFLLKALLDDVSLKNI